MSTGASDAILDALGDAVRHRAGELLVDVVRALVSPLDDLDGLIGDGEVYDLDRTPQPNLLGQLVGTRAPDGLTPAAQAQWIRDHPTWLRGTPGQMVRAVRDLIGPWRTADLVERDGSPWQLTLQVDQSELDLVGVTVDDVYVVALPQKPYGIVLTVQGD